MTLEGEVPEVFDAKRFARMLCVYLCFMGVETSWAAFDHGIEKMKPRPMTNRVIELCRKALS